MHGFCFPFNFVSYVILSLIAINSWWKWSIKRASDSVQMLLIKAVHLFVIITTVLNNRAHIMCTSTWTKYKNSRKQYLHTAMFSAVYHSPSRNIYNFALWYQFFAFSAPDAGWSIWMSITDILGTVQHTCRLIPANLKWYTCLNHSVITVAIYKFVHSVVDMQPGDYVFMTNVHAMIHKPTDQERSSQLGPTVELCIHGGGKEKYHRGLAIANDYLPDVRRLKLKLAECMGDTDGSDVEPINREHVMAVASDTGQSTDECIPHQGPVIGVLGSRDLSSVCLKRLAESINSPVKKRKASVESCSSTNAGASNYPRASDDASSSLMSVDNQSSLVENTKDRCILSTSAGLFFQQCCSCNDKNIQFCNNNNNSNNNNNK